MTRSFQTLDNLAHEYRANAALLELRLVQLKHQLRQTQCLEVRRRLKHRIGMLHVLINETRGTGYYLAHYYGEREQAC